MVSLEPPEICDVGSGIATAVGKHQKCKVKSGVKLDFIMLEPPKIFEVKSG